MEALALANENNIGKVVFVKEEKSIYNIVGAGELKKIVYSPEFIESLNSKVDKERGKGLSTNDYSNSEKKKLKEIEENAQRNIIEEVYLNGDKIEPVDKVVSLDAVKSIDGQTGDITLKGDSENAWDVNSHIVNNQIQSKVVTPKSVGSSTTPVYFDENGEVSPINIDTEVTENSDNLITSGAVHRNLNLKQDRLEAGEHITIEDNVISFTNDIDLSEYAKTEDVNRKLVSTQDTIAAALSSEATARVTSDNALDARINEEAAARIAGDEAVLAKVAEEREARESADATLSESIEYLKRGKAYVMGETLIFRNYADVQIIGNTLKF